MIRTPPALASVQRNALIVGLAGILLGGAGWVMDPHQFYRSYLVSFVYVLSIPLGCLGLLMMQHLSGGAWGVMLRRVFEAASRTFPLVALFAVPLLLGMTHVYHWAEPEAQAHDPLLHHKAAYLNVGFFTVRTVLYFVIWSALAWLLSRMSLEQDRTGNPALAVRMQRVSAAGLLLFVLAMTFASIDWLMSLDPHWHSTIYGFYFGGGAAISAMAFCLLAALFLASRAPMSGTLRPAHFHDYGKLLLAFVVIWAYFNASQLIIIYQGHIPEEITWYKPRMVGGWWWVSLLLVLLHFVLPFFLLLSRDLKRDISRLSAIALLLLVMRWVDIYWLAAPAFSPERVAPHWLDLVLPAGLGGVWLAYFARELRTRPLLPANEPHLREALSHE